MYKIKNFKGFNWLGFWTLYSKEVRRFLNVFAQTVLAPAITTLLFYIIFTISVDRNYLNSENYIFSEFLAPGLVCMAIMQNAFANTSKRKRRVGGIGIRTVRTPRTPRTVRFVRIRLFLDFSLFQPLSHSSFWNTQFQGNLHIRIATLF